MLINEYLEKVSVEFLEKVPVSTTSLISKSSLWLFKRLTECLMQLKHFNIEEDWRDVL